MARKIRENNRLRLVFTGPSAQPTQMAVEYSVVDGDLAEASQRVEFDDTNFEGTVKDLWKSTVTAIKKAEKLS